MTGPARVFDDEQSALAAILAGQIKAGDVMVLRYLGPKGGPGMPEMLAPTGALIGAGLGEDAIEPPQFLGTVEDHQLAATVEGDAVGFQKGVQGSAARDALASLQRTGRVVEPAMDDFGVPRRDPLADPRTGLQHHGRSNLWQQIHHLSYRESIQLVSHDIV